MRNYMVILLGMGLSACADPGLDPGASSAPTTCELAARHLESCTGAYLTPPPCEGGAPAEAEAILGRSCEALAEAEHAAAGKADGALCNWFGSGCVPDEPIFTGPSCASAAQCPTGHACLEGRCFAGLGSAEAEAMLDTLTGSAASDGNAVTGVLENAEARQAWLDLVAGAQRSVHVVSLLIEDNATGHAVVAALGEAARRGVEVRVIVDSVSQYSYGNYELLAELAGAGVQMIAFNPVAEWSAVRWDGEVWISANQRIHEKVLVVDGRVALAGGRNVGDSYLADGRWRDRDVLVTGPAVADLQRLFLTDWDEFTEWERRAGCPLRAYGVYCRPAGQADLRGQAAYFAAAAAGSARVRVIHSNPRKEPKPDGYVTYLALIRSAQRSIKITNAYFVPPQRLRRHLRAAAARGVRVEVVTNSKTSNDERSMWWAAINHYEELIKGGVKICEWRGTETVHVKAMVVDDRVAVVGSYNLDPRSATTNSEALVLIQDPTSVAQLAAAWGVDRTRCDLAGYSFSWYDWAMATTHRLAEPLF